MMLMTSNSPLFPSEVHIVGRDPLPSFVGFRGSDLVGFRVKLGKR